MPPNPTSPSNPSPPLPPSTNGSPPTTPNPPASGSASTKKPPTKNPSPTPKPSTSPSATAGSTASSNPSTPSPGSANSPPRAPTSNWSKINTQHAARLIASNQMTPAGLAHITAAQADGRWSAAYDSQSNTAPPPDFLQLLAQNKKAQAFFHRPQQSQPLRHRLSPADRQKAGNPRPPPTTDSRHARQPPKIPPLTICQMNSLCVLCDLCGL